MNRKFARASHAAAVLLTAVLAVPGFAAPARVRFVDPAPNAKLVRRESAVLLRFDRALRSFEAAPSFLVTGSVSGVHPGTIVRADGGAALSFRPVTPFAPGERVRVQCMTGASIEPGRAADFSFDVSPMTGESPAAWADDSDDPMMRRYSVGSPSAHEAGADSLPGFPNIVFQTDGLPAPGRLLIATLPFMGGATPWLAMLDENGDPTVAEPGMGYDFKQQPNGLYTYFSAAAGKFYEVDGSLTVVDSFACGNGYTTDVHELRVLDDGHALLMSYDPQPVDMSAIVPGGNPAATVIGLVVQELDAAKNVVFQWRSWDHIPITDATHENLLAANIDYAHGNAIERDFDGNLLVSSRHLDEITKIDRQTGAILWRWGGKQNMFTFVGDTLPFSHQHHIRRIANGHYTLFDNGNFHTPHFSRAVEYVLDENAMTAEAVWEYRRDPDTYGNAMGSVQRLPNGSTLVAWGTGKPDVTEVNAQGFEVLSLRLPAGTFTYRAFHERLADGLDVTPNDAPAAFALAPAGANPFGARTALQLSLPVAASVTLKLYDTQGRLVRTLLDGAPKAAGRHVVTLDLAGEPSGVYFARLSAGGTAVTRRLVHLYGTAGMR